MCSVNSFGVTARPASSKATFKPASASCLAAQPPVAPDALSIQISKAVQKRALRLAGFGCQYEIDVTIHQRFLGAGRVRRGNDEVAEDDERFILVLIQKERLPSRGREVF